MAFSLSADDTKGKMQHTWVCALASEKLYLIVIFLSIKLAQLRPSKYLTSALL